MQSLCIQYNEITAVKTYSSWGKAVQAVEEHLKLYYPTLEEWKVEQIMLQLENRPYIVYKDFYADLS